MVITQTASSLDILSESPTHMLPHVRVDTDTGRRGTIIAPHLIGDQYSLHTDIDGTPIPTKTGKVFSPKHPLFFVEDRALNELDEEFNTRIFTTGADERIKESELSGSALEELLHTFISRTFELQERALNHESLAQFYTYASYDIFNKKLNGRLLATNVVPPSIDDEVKAAKEYLEMREKVKYNDVIRYEISTGFNEENRLVGGRGDFVGFVPYAPLDPQHIKIAMRANGNGNISRVTQLNNAQVKDLAFLIHDCIKRIMIVAAKGQRFYELVHVALHSAPNKYHTDNWRYTSPRPSRATNPVDDYYRFHIEMSPGEIPRHGAPYSIPFSGWQVIPKRPKDIARELREAK